MKNQAPIRVIISVLIVSLLLSCAGKKGDPGPAGTNGTNGTNGANGATGPVGTDPSTPFANGSFSGNIAGIAQDGTPFSGTFNYPYAIGYEYFEKQGNITLLHLRRNQLFELSYNGGGISEEDMSGSLDLYFSISNLGLPNQSISLNSELVHYNAITNNQLFIAEAFTLYLKDIQISYPIDPNNQTYGFTFSQFTGLYDAGSNYTTAVFQSKFITTAGDTVYYDDPTFDPSGNGKFLKVVSSTGVSSATSATYDVIHLISHQGPNGSYVTFSDANDTDLTKTVIQPADTYSINNFIYDTTTALLSFDFTLSLGKFSNSTGNQLKITGKFTGNVYTLKD